MTSEELARRLARVRERVERACDRAGRDAGSVELLPVTKGHPAILIDLVAAAGVADVGENRVSEAEAKQDARGRAGVAWHMIGRLQRNKARRAVACFDEIGSVDSHRLARRLSDLAVESGSPVPVLVQVNASGEQAKTGFSPAAIVDAVSEIGDLPGLVVRGLMTMAPYTDDESVLRATFATARRAFEACRAGGYVEGGVLSMGMSNDFELAVEEGSTRVRLGTALFGDRE